MSLLMGLVLIAPSISWCAHKRISFIIYAAQEDTPILVASRYGRAKTLKVLLRAKANVDDGNQKAMHFGDRLFLCPLSTLDEFSSTLCRLEVQGVDTCVY